MAEKKKNRFSRREFLLSGLLAALGLYGYINKRQILSLARKLYARYLDRKPNIIVIAMDTLRADRLGCYGNTRGISPNIDEFAKDGTLYWNTLAQSNWTLPAFCSIFTGLYPHQHFTGMGFEKKLNRYLTKLPRGFPTLAEVLSAMGYMTVAYTGGIYLSPHVNLDRGFDEFYMVNEDSVREVKANDLPWQLDNSTDWLVKNHKKRKFFLFIHSYECHNPWVAPKKYVDSLDPNYDGPQVYTDIPKDLYNGERLPTDAEIERYKTIYDAEVMFSDDLLGEFFSFLKKEGIYDDSLIIFTSDHGEEFFEHGGWKHGHRSMYDEVLRVPVIIKYPKNEIVGVNYDRLARQIDIMPTILYDVLKVERGLVEMAGQPLSEPISEPYSISETKMRATGIEYFGFRSDSKKYIIGKDPVEHMAFDLKKNPNETNDIADELSLMMEEVSYIAHNAESYYVDNRKNIGKSETVDEKTIKRLKELGYLQ